MMTIHDVAIAKIHQLPQPLIEEVNDFIDFLLMKLARDTALLPQPTVISALEFDRIPAGSAKGLITIAEDFDAPLEDFQDYMA